MNDLTELMEQKRFNMMLIQAYKSLDASENHKHLSNVLDGWFNRLVNEFEMSPKRTIALQCLLQAIIKKGKRLERQYYGSEIIKKAFNNQPK